ncbi:MAG: FAD-binding oxidoreductase, partial [Planctomycetota bacterium]
NVHPSIAYDGRDRREQARVVAAGREMLQACVDAGGSITGEHGIGSEKMEYVSFMFSPTDLEVFGELRASFDPNGLCNPGKVCPSGGSCSEGRSARLPEALGD